MTEITGTMVREFREAVGLSQAEAAERLGVAKKTVYNWEARGDEALPSAAARRFALEARAALVSQGVVKAAPRSLVDALGLADLVGVDQEGPGPGEFRSAGSVPTRVGVARVVREERLSRGWSVEEAARRAGLTPETWRRVEEGERAQSASRGDALEALGLDLAAVRSRLGEDLHGEEADGLFQDIYDPSHPSMQAALRARRTATRATLKDAEQIVELGTKAVEALTALASELRDEGSPRAVDVNAVLPDVLGMWLAAMKITGAIHPLRELVRDHPALSDRLGDSESQSVREADQTGGESSGLGGAGPA